MAIKTREEILTALSTLIGDNDTTEYLSLLEDITDTVDSVSNGNSEIEEWKNKYEQRNTEYADLHAKYKERFFSTPSNNNNPPTPPTDHIVDDVEPTEFDDLFVESED